MFKPERLAAFCDGVIAIAITLLVLGLEVPSVHEVPDQQLNRFLYESIHSLLGYISSFILIGTYWLQHYVIFHYIKQVDRPFAALNGLFLLCISFVPFPTGLQATYRQDELAMVIYAGTHVVCGLSLMAIWIYATRHHRLIDATTSPAVIKHMTWRLGFTPIVGLAALALSHFSIDLSRILFVAIPVAYLTRGTLDQTK